MEEAVALWAETGLPVVSHCGVNSYYPDDSPEAATQNPAYGNLEDFMYLVERLPQVKFIAAHAGGLTGGEAETLAAHLGGAENLWVDTTFRSAEEMRMLVELFGEDRVLFGVDRPFGGTRAAVKTAFEASGRARSCPRRSCTRIWRSSSAWPSEARAHLPPEVRGKVLPYATSPR